MSYRKWYQKSWQEHYAHSGWSSLSDEEVEDEMPLPTPPGGREPYFEEWEEGLARYTPATPPFLARLKRLEEAGEEEEREEEELQEEIWVTEEEEGLPATPSTEPQSPSS